MTSSNAANNNRLMKWVDFSHDTPRIYLPKPYVTALANLAKLHTDKRHRECVTIVGSCFCGIKKCFNEYYIEHRFDLDFREAMVFHKDVVADCIKDLSRSTGLNESLIKQALDLPIVLVKRRGTEVYLEKVDWRKLLSENRNSSCLV